MNKHCPRYALERMMYEVTYPGIIRADQSDKIGR